ncbi:MAG: hypothetical protein WBC06_17835 [Chitinophagaceae bacterium]
MQQRSFLLFLPVFIIGLLSCGDNKTKSQPATKNDATVAAASVKTAQHVKIPNSHLYIVPPAGFSVNETSGTLAKGEGYAHFLMMNLISGYTPEKYFAELKVQADKDFPGSWKQEDIIADGHKATIYQYKNAAILQHYLAFTDGYTDEMIIANFEESESATGKEMYEAMKTVVAEK